jgi:hypothetical protein
VERFHRCLKSARRLRGSLDNRDLGLSSVRENAENQRTQEFVALPLNYRVCNTVRIKTIDNTHGMNGFLTAVSHVLERV